MAVGASTIRCNLTGSITVYISTYNGTTGAKKEKNKHIRKKHIT